VATPDSDPVVAEMDPGLLPDPLDHLCGRCGKPTWFQLRSAVWAGEYFAGSSGYGPDRHPIIAATYQCPGCGLATLFEFQFYHVIHEPHASLLRSYPTAAAICKRRSKRRTPAT